jgi:two-component system, sensor histidine kinase and response regulator
MPSQPALLDPSADLQQTSQHLVVFAVDDSPDDLALLRYHLARIKGFTVDLHATTLAAEVPRLLSGISPDIAFFDYQLGACTGWELFAELQRKGVSFPVILLADQGDEELAAETIKKGFADYLPKEVIGPKSLKRAIGNSLESFRLRHALIEYSTNLEHMVKELRSRNAEIQSFYHSLSHELKTPLTAMREFVSIVLDGLQGPLNDGQRDSLETSKAACDHMVACINDILDSSRLDTGKLSLQARRQPLAPVLRRAVAHTSALAAERKVVVTCGVTDDGLSAWIDDQRIVQVLNNLIGNAIKFSPLGARVSIHASAATEPTGFVRVSVRDNGCGIDPLEHERIFERLHQTSVEDAAVRGGLGLGLYLCRELVQLHGGSIGVRSEVGQGSEFIFFLPVNKSIPNEKVPA